MIFKNKAKVVNCQAWRYPISEINHKTINLGNYMLDVKYISNGWITSYEENRPKEKYVFLPL